MNSYRWSDMKTELDPALRLEIAVAAEEIRARLHPTELRCARELTHRGLAKVLDGGQAAVISWERRTAIYLRALRTAFESMDVELVVLARFPDGSEVPVRLDGLTPNPEPGTIPGMRTSPESTLPNP
ncbi:MAG: hypothetical protein ABI743_00320 [bacterium]